MNYPARTFAQLAGVTVKALRHYERRGLLSPGRSAAGYRRYALRDLQRLEWILALKSLGLPLGQVARLTESADVDALRAQRERLAEARSRIDRAIAALDGVADAADPAAALRRFVMHASWERWEGVTCANRIASVLDHRLVCVYDTGQQSHFRFFVVAGVAISDNRAAISRELGEAEVGGGKRLRDWRHTTPERRIA